MLRAHTARCVPCAAFQADTVTITHKLRLAPLALLPGARLRCRLAAVSWAGSPQVGAAAAVAVLTAAGIGALLSTSPQPTQADRGRSRRRPRRSWLFRVSRRTSWPAAAPAAGVPAAPGPRLGTHGLESLACGL